MSERRPRQSAGMPHPSAIDRLPPHSIEAEQAVLGCILLDEKFALPIVSAMFGNKEEFYDLRHQVVYEKMVELANENIPINVVTLGERLKAINALESAGGYIYLSALPDVSPSAFGVEHFAQIVSDKATLRRLITACVSTVSNVYDNEGMDVEKILTQAEQAIMGVRRMVRSKSEPVKELVHQAIEIIERQHESGGQLGGISTGFSDLDKMHDGLHAGEMIVVSGFPGAGKTAFAMNIAEYVAIEMRKPVGIFSFEMEPLQLILRMLASRSRVNLRNVRDGFLAERDFPRLTGAAGKIANAPIYVEKASGMTVAQLRARARQMAMEHDIKLWVVDYTQIVAESGAKENNREREVANISHNLKQMAGELGAPVLALSQLNDDGLLRESRAIGQDADSVWALEVEKRKGAEEGAEEGDEDVNVVPVNLRIRKQRNGPSPATIALTFFKCYTRYESAAKITEEDYQQTNIPYADR